MPRRLDHHPLTPFAFLAPALAILGVFWLLALAQVFYYSFTNYTPFQTPEFKGFENYERLLSSRAFWVCLGNAAAYLLVTPVLIVLSMQAAFVVRARLRCAPGLRVLLFLPVVTPTIVAAVAWRVLYNEDAGLLNSTLAALGLPEIRWLTERPWTLVSAMLVTLWKGFGFYMMVFLAALIAVPRELEEAASLDGAGRLGVLRHVVLPSIWPVIALVSIISSIAALKVFDELFVTIRGAPIEHQTVVPLVYQTAFERGEYGLACAIGITLFAVILGFSLLNLRLSRSDAGAPR
ncbi:MAG: sugar ABC transporter permease [Planctomycetota bacterium]